MERRKFSVKKLILIIVACIIVSIPTVVLPTSTVIVYEGIFSMRPQTQDYLMLDVSDYDGLLVERSDFESSSKLAGFKYSKQNQESRGLIIIAHGLGDGGHNKYLPYIDFFTSNGFYVFAYDAQGSDLSDEKSVKGFPQGIKDLDSAINHTKEIAEYKDLPLMLFGHSWGAYSVGNVLNLHPEVKGAVMVAGFNESEDMIAQYPRMVLGELVDAFLLPYVEIYERIKFGKEYTDITAIDGMEKTNAKILIAHSTDDKRVPYEYGYEKYYEKFSENERFEFIKYDDKGHADMLYSDEAIAYREELENGYETFLEQNGKKDNKKSLNEYMSNSVDAKRYYEPNAILLEKILNLYNSTIGEGE